MMQSVARARSFFITASVAFVAGWALPSGGQAQSRTVLPPIIVTAEADPTIEQPRPITRLTGTEIEAAGIEELPDLQSRMPNSVFRSGGTRSLNHVMGFRGVVNNAYYGEPAVSLYVDDVPYPTTLSYDAALLATDHIDIYRGPQFARFGRRGATGLVSIQSREPGDRLRVEGSASYATYDEQIYKLSLETPLGPQFSVSASGLYSRRDGFLHNELSHVRPDYADAFTGRFSFQWSPTPEWKVQLIVAGQRFDDGTQRFTATDSSPYDAEFDFSGVTDGSSDVQAVRVRYVGDKIRFTSVTARRDFRLDPASFDLDFTPLPFARVFVFADVLQYSQEFRLESAPDEPFGWLLGAYASWTEVDNEVDDTTPSLASSLLHDKAFALFGEATARVGEHLAVTIGLRGDHIHKTAERKLAGPTGLTSRQSKAQRIENVSPKLQLTWHFNKDVLAYATTALSYRPGSYSVFNLNPEISESETERTWASEIGAKARLLDDKLELSLSAFWYEIENYQIERYLASGFGIFSADHVLSRGVELEAVARPARGLELTASVGYTDARFTEHTQAETGRNLSGQRPPYIPDVTAHFGASYRHDSGFSAHVDWLLTGRTYFDEGNTKSYAQNAYGLLNARIGYEREHWGVYLFGRNLTASEYYTVKVFPLPAGIISEPRILGIMTSFKF